MEMRNIKKTQNFNLSKIQIIILILTASAILASILLFIPTVQNLILKMGEIAIRRKINYPEIWIRKICAIAAISIFIFVTIAVTTLFSPPRSISNLLENIKRFYTDKNAIFGFVVATIFMIITHGFCFVNLMYSHDSLFFASDGIGKITIGRWLYPFIVNLRTIASPYLMGFLSTLFVSLSVYFVVKIFDLNKLNSFIVAMLFTTNFTLTSLFYTYIFDADADCLALLFTCVAIYLIENQKKTSYVFGSLLLIFSLALYQTYFCLFATFILFIFMKKAIKLGDDYKLKNIFIELGKYAAIFCVSFIIYVILTKLSSVYYNIGLSNGYNGPGRLKEINYTDFLYFIPRVIKTFINHFFIESFLATKNFPFLIINLLVAISLIFELVLIYQIFKNNLLKFFIILICVLLLPFAVFGFLLISKGTIHDLMLFSSCFYYFLPFYLFRIIFDENEKTNFSITSIKNIEYCMLIVIICFSFRNICYANNSYLFKKLIYNNTALHAQAVWKDINSLDGYIEGESVVVLMDWENSLASYFDRSEIIKRNNTDNFYLTGECNSSITYPGTGYMFFRHILGRNIIIKENLPEIMNNLEFINMPAYPKEGYIKEIDGKFVVKMANIK